MTEDKNKIEIRSEEVQEIMGTPPKWIVRWGIVIILTVVIILILGSFYYKYPDIIEARVTVVSQNPPIPIVARSDGKLDRIFVTDNQKVKVGDLLGIIENPANYKDVYSLKQFLDSIQSYFAEPEAFNNIQLKQDYQLGQNHSLYASFISQLKDFQTFIRYNSFEQKIRSLEREVRDYRNLNEKLRNQINVLNDNYVLANNQFMRDSALHARKVMSDVDFEKSKAAMLEQKFAYGDAQSNLANTQITMNQLNQQIQEQKVSKAEDENKKLATLKERYDNLSNQLFAWEQTYVLETPIAGQITFNDFWSINQFVSSGDIVFTVVPENELEIIGKANVPVTGAGKVEVGQRVNIKLDNFPYLEFGFLEGEVSNLSKVPVSNEKGIYYTAEIKLKNNLITNTNKRLPFKQEMQGYAEIITKDRRLIERLIEPLVSVFKERF